MAWTKEQQLAIDTEDKHLLVAAAAGSGKTAVLVNRIIRKILEGKTNVDEILAITFTHAAAEEMQERIEAAIINKIESETDEKTIALLERQRILLSGANISTLHSFCQRIIRLNFSVLGLDPEFRMAGEEELRLIKQDAIDELFEEEYEVENEAFLRFTDAFGGDAKGDVKIYSLILRLYEFSRSESDPKAWLNWAAKLLNLDDDSRLKDTPWYDVIEKDISLKLENALFEANRVLDGIEEFALTAYESTVNDDISEINNLIRAVGKGEFSLITDAFSSVNFKRLPTVKGADEEFKILAQNIVKDPRDFYKDIIKNLKEKYFQIGEEDYIENLKTASKDMAELVRLVNKFDEKFSALKRSKNILDFSDLEHYALKLLIDEDAKKENIVKPSKVAIALGEKFKEIMVDEYQDTSGVQEALISLIIAAGNAKLFCVGDVKQSIYRFRLADPSLFLKKYREYRTLGEKYSRIDLAKNFRSREEIISAINYIFMQVMNEETMELDYGKDEALYLGADYPEAENTLKSPTELTIFIRPTDKEKDEEENIISELSALEEEAHYIAKQIKKLIVEKKQVFDKELKEYRPISYRDIVILLRSVQGKADVILDVLKNYDIPAHATVDGGYFQNTEVRLMLAFLTVLHNSRQDIPLAAVLASPVGNFTYEEIAELRANFTQGDLFDSLLFATFIESDLNENLKKKVSDFLAKLSKWRTLARENSVADLIFLLYQDTGFYDYVGALPNGLIRQGNLRLLIDRAAAYEETDYRGLFRFLQFVKKIEKTSTDLSSAKTLSENEDVLRIMSIHKSKGLEFPVVILADLGKSWNTMDTSSELLIHSKLGLGPYFVDIDSSYRYPTFPRAAISTKIYAENIAEELRTFYVALTRAKEKLIMVGSFKGEENFIKKLKRYAPFVNSTDAKLPGFVTFGANSYLDFMLMSLIRHKDGESLREAAECYKSPVKFLNYNDNSKWIINISSPFAEENAEENNLKDDILLKVKNNEKLPESAYKNEVENILNWRYDDRGLKEVKGKISVTELKRRFLEIESGGANIFKEEISFNRPEFLQKTTKLTSTEYGTLMHGVMEHLNHKNADSLENIKAEIDKLVSRDIIKKDDVSRINLKHILGFFTSKIGLRLREARRIYKELPFSRFIDANRVYKSVKNEKIITQGIIDLLFIDENDKLILIDYKTDKYTSEKTMKERYSLQIALYKEAAEEILNRKVDESYLYMLTSGKLIII